MAHARVLSTSAAILLATLASAVGGRSSAGAPLSAARPAQPTDAVTIEVLGSLGGRVASVAATDGFLYLGEGRHVVVYAVGPAGTLTRVGQSGVLLDRPRDLAAQGAYLYAATEWGLQTLDITAPAWPRLVDTVAEVRGASISLSGATLAIGASGWRAAITLLDVSQPAQPRVVGSVLPTDWGYPVQDVLVDGRLLVASGQGSRTGIQLFDISDPGRPLELGSGLGNVGPLARSGDVVYVGGSSTLELWDIANVSAPSRLASLPFDGGVGQLDRDGDLLAAQGGVMGLRLFDVSDARHPVLLAELSGSGVPAGLVLVGKMLFAAYDTLGRPGGVTVVDVADPRHPRVVDEVVVAGSPVATAAHGQSLVVLTSNRGVGTHGVSLASDTRCGGLVVQRVHWFRDAGFAPLGAAAAPAATWVLGSRGGDLVGGLPVLQALSPDIGAELGSVVVGEFNEVPSALANHGDTLYVAGDAGLVVVDGSDPSQPRIVARQAGDFRDVAVAGDVMAALADTRLVVGRIVEPLALPPLAPVDGAGAVDAMALAGTALYARSGTELRQYSLADAGAPRLVATGQAGAGSLWLAADDGMLATWGNSSRVNVFTMAGDMLRQVGSLDATGLVAHVTVDQGRVFAATGEWGLVEARVLGVSGPSPAAPHGAHRVVLPLVTVGCETSP